MRQRLWNWSLRCYRILLRVYPRDFRNEFGEQLDQSFRDISRDESRRGLWGLAMLWGRVLPDLAYSAITARQSSDLGWQFRLRWVAANMCGYILYPFAVDAVRYCVGFPYYIAGIRIYIPNPPEIFAAVSCLTLAILQSLVVSNRSFDRKRWILFTLGAEGVISVAARAGMFSMRDPSLTEIVSVSFCAGALTGLAQSLALRRRSLQIVVWCVAVAIGQIAMTLFYVGIYPQLPSLADSGVILISNLTFLRALVQASTGLTGGIITAAPLEWILRTRPRTQES